MVRKMIISLDELLKIELKDKVIVFQTDTVYGVGCLINSESGVNKIYEIKKREKRNPLAVLCSNIEQVKDLVYKFELGEKYAKEFWPGAMTLVYPKKESIGDFITSGLSTIGVRIPKDNTLPMLVIYDNCKHFQRTVPALQFAENDPEDVDTKMEDHI